MEEATRTQKVKDHFKKHKGVYIGVGVGLTAGVVIGTAASNTSVVNINVQKLFNWKTSDVTTNVTNVQVVRRASPGKTIFCPDTGEQWASISRAAEVLGVSRSAIQNHLAGKTPNVLGLTLKNLGDPLPDFA